MKRWPCTLYIHTHCTIIKYAKIGHIWKKTAPQRLLSFIYATLLFLFFYDLYLLTIVNPPRFSPTLLYIQPIRTQNCIYICLTHYNKNTCKKQYFSFSTFFMTFQVLLMYWFGSFLYIFRVQFYLASLRLRFFGIAI